MTFADASMLKLDNPASFTGQIDGLAVGDIIDLSGTAVTKAVIAGATLTVTESDEPSCLSNRRRALRQLLRRSKRWCGRR